jgi:hypothetical protein
VQYLSVVPILFYAFGGVACFVFCGTESALLASMVVIPSSHNIVTSLSCSSVDYFIPAITILKCDCKLALNTVIKKLSMVGIYKP